MRNSNFPQRNNRLFKKDSEQEHNDITEKHTQVHTKPAFLNTVQRQVEDEQDMQEATDIHENIKSQVDSQNQAQANAAPVQQKKESEEKEIQKKGDSQPSKAPQSPLRNSNQMPAWLQGKMESSFNTDFSDVHVHKNDDKASALGAQAFTQGNNVHFAPGKYNPGSQQGQELIGHELTHVVQQRSGKVSPTTQQKGTSINDDSSLEKEADDMGKKAASGGSASLKKTQAVQTAHTNPVQRKKEHIVRFEVYPKSGTFFVSTNLGNVYKRTWTSPEIKEGSYSISGMQIAGKSFQDQLSSTLDQKDPLKSLIFSASGDITVVVKGEKLKNGAGNKDDSGQGTGSGDAGEGSGSGDESGNAGSKPGSKDEQSAPEGAKGASEDPKKEQIKNPDKKLKDFPDEMEVLKQLPESLKKQILELEIKDKVSKIKEQTPEMTVWQISRMLERILATEAIKKHADKFELELSNDPDDTQPKISNRPVRGSIVAPGNSTGIFTEKTGAKFMFAIKDNVVSAYRVPFVVIRWVLTKPDGSTESNFNKFIPTRDPGIFDDHAFDVSLKEPGNYTVEAIVDHNFFLPNYFVKPITVVTHEEARKEFEEKEKGNVDSEKGKDIGDETTEWEGDITEDISILHEMSPEVKMNKLRSEHDNLTKILKALKRRPGSDELIRVITLKLHQVDTAYNDLKKHESSHHVKCWGNFVSRTQGYESHNLDLACWFDFNLYSATRFKGTMRDISGLMPDSATPIEATGRTYTEMINEMFAALYTRYPLGELTLNYQNYTIEYGKAVPSGSFKRWRRDTDTNIKYLQRTIFNEKVSMAINIGAAFLTAFPPTAPFGIGISLAYNAADTSLNYYSKSTAGTLRTADYVQTGMLALDIIPVLGTTKRAVKIGSRTMHLIDAAQHGGNVYCLTEEAYMQIEQLKISKISELQKVQTELEEARKKNDQALISAKEKEFLAIKKEVEEATDKVITDMVISQGITLMSTTAASKLGSALHTPKEHAKAKAGGDSDQPGSHPDDAPDGTSHNKDHTDSDVDGSNHTKDHADSDAGVSGANKHNDAHAGKQGMEEGTVKKTKTGVRVEAVSASKSPFKEKTSHHKELAAYVPKGKEGAFSSSIGADPDMIAVKYQKRFGFITDIHVEVGKNHLHNPDFIKLHIQTALELKNYSGLSGMAYTFDVKLRDLISRYTNIVERKPPLGSEAWEAYLEVKKINTAIDFEINKLIVASKAGSDSEVKAAQGNIKQLEAQLRQYEQTIKDFESDVRYLEAKGKGYIAAELSDVSRAKEQKVLEAGDDDYRGKPGAGETRHYRDNYGNQSSATNESGKKMKIEASLEPGKVAVRASSENPPKIDDPDFIVDEQKGYQWVNITGATVGVNNPHGNAWATKKLKAFLDNGFDGVLYSLGKKLNAKDKIKIEVDLQKTMHKSGAEIIERVTYRISSESNPKNAITVDLNVKNPNSPNSEVFMHFDGDKSVQWKLSDINKTIEENPHFKGQVDVVRTTDAILKETEAMRAKMIAHYKTLRGDKRLEASIIRLIEANMTDIKKKGFASENDVWNLRETVRSTAAGVFPDFGNKKFLAHHKGFSDSDFTPHENAATSSNPFSYGGGNVNGHHSSQRDSGKKTEYVNDDGVLIIGREGKNKYDNLSGETRGLKAIESIEGYVSDNGEPTVIIKGKVQESISAGRGERDKYERRGTQSAKDIGVEGYQNAHLVGPGFGDEALDGLMFAPEAVNQKFQNLGVENFMRGLHKSGVEVQYELKAVGHSKEAIAGIIGTHGKEIKLKNREELLKEVSYGVSVKTADGKVHHLYDIVISVGLPPEGKVTTHLSQGSGYAQLDNLDFGTAPNHPPATGNSTSSDDE